MNATNNLNRKKPINEQTSVPTLKRKEGSANIRFLNIEQFFIRKDNGQAEPYKKPKSNKIIKIQQLIKKKQNKH